ncbi:MAG: hypothetical protein ABIJ92_05245 [Candidatus Aenigmatarchaeota archaeon]
MKPLTEDQFYEAACKIISESSEAKLASSSLKSEPSNMVSYWKNKYQEHLLEGIRNKRKNIKYVIPKQKTKMILKKSNAGPLLRAWKDLVDNNSVDLRYTDKKFDTCIIGGNMVLVKKASQRFLYPIGSKEGQEIVQNFDKVFITASNDHTHLFSDMDKKTLYQFIQNNVNIF